MALHAANQPNILIVLTDDQGWGDMSCHGNPHLKTPNIDRLEKEGVEFTRFYVSPVCAPTRASLMTGRYNYRTGVTDTWFGRATMAAEELTLAESLKEAGYATGLFGKWHLGDNYPYRPEDQGFDEVLMHRGGGIAQPSCPPGNSYSDPLLIHNGVMKKFTGYCMDIYTDATIAFIKANKDKPFFAYLATNTPHAPLQVSDVYAEPFRKAGLAEETSKVYGMVANIDENLGRLLETLDSSGLSENTIVIFMSDNGPKIFNETDRFTGSLRGEKTTVFEGGIKAPFFIRWTGKLETGRKIDTIAAHIDVMPTLLDLCDVSTPADVEFDGTSLVPLINGNTGNWPARTLFLQWHRGNSPDEYRNFAAVSDRYKLLQNKDRFDADKEQQFELYDLSEDLSEATDVSPRHPETVERLKGAYDQWFSDVGKNGYRPSPAWIDPEHENPTVLTQQDRRDAEKWGNDNYFEDAYWPIRVFKPGSYVATIRLFEPTDEKAKAVLQIDEKAYRETIDKDSDAFTFKPVKLDEKASRITAWIEYGKRRSAPQFLEIKK